MFMKRDHDNSPQDSSPSDAKRFRPEEILGSAGDDRVITRLLMSRFEFSKLIGKGGATITHIRSATGVNVRGTNIEEDSRLVLLVGPFQNVIRAFDMVSELLNNGSAIDGGIISASILLEHSKAGKIVGSKGAMIQQVQMKSGCVNVKIEKDPKEYSGVSLRKLSLDGTLSAVRRAHYIVHELYSTDSIFAPHVGSSSFLLNNSRGSNSNSNNNFNDQSGHQGGAFYSEPDGSLPFPALINHGVQTETVGQLTDMKAYLSRHFGLNLLIVKDGQMFKNAASPSMVTPLIPAEKLTLEQTIDNRKSKSTSHQELCFGVPKSTVGGIIGKSGSLLKDLQTEFNVRMHVEKEDFGGKRLVVINSVTGENAIADDEHKIQAMLHCQAKIQAIVEEQLQAEAEAAAGAMMTGDD
jgi:predicted RNA-binding protein YlqC (UPF0109 family)